MNVGSLFSGIGGLDLGLERAGMHIMWQVEADPYRRKVLRTRFPDVPVAPDVVRFARTLADNDDDGPSGRGEPAIHGRRQARAGIPARVDIIVGGFPCQDVSIAGRRAGLQGERSSLFHEYARIVAALRPRWVLIENVPGLLNSNGGRDFGVVLGTMADLGYGMAWRTLDSRFFGVPQRRRRLFVVGNDVGGRVGADRSGEILAIGSRCPWHPTTSREQGEGVAHVASDGTGSTTARPLGSLADGGYRTTDLDGVGAYISDMPVAATLSQGSHPNSNAAGRRHEDDVNLVRETYVSDVAPPIIPRYSKGTDSNAEDAFVGGAQGIRRLTPTECERLQGFPDGWTDIGRTADTPRYAAIGDAVTVPVAEWIGTRLLQHERHDR